MKGLRRLIPLLLLVSMLPLRFAAAAGNDFSVDFIAAEPSTYNHVTGVGGIYDARTIGTDVVESLAGADFACGDKVVFFAAIDVDPGTTPEQTLNLDFSFLAEPTGSPGVAFGPILVASANPLSDTGQLTDGDEVVSPATQPMTLVPGPGMSPDEWQGSVTITNLGPDDTQFILRLVTDLVCTTGTPTGVLQAALTDADVVAPAGEIGGIPGGGNMTVPLKNVDNIARTGTITIIKDRVPNGAGTFSFTGSAGLPANFQLDDDDTTPAIPSFLTFTGLTPGPFTVTEGLDAGFTQTVSCSDPSGGTTTNNGTRTASIDLRAGETVTCIFTNVPPNQPPTGSITIIKDRLPNGADTFNFTGSPTPLPATFQLDDNAATPGTPSFMLFSGLPLNSYTVTEGFVAGYTQTVSCTDPSGDTTTNNGTRTASIVLGAESVVCTFTNDEITVPDSGTITIRKVVPTDYRRFSFRFLFDGRAEPFQLGDGQQIVFDNLVEGNYIIREIDPSGFHLADIDCTPDAGFIDINVDLLQVAIDLPPGEDVVCTFFNEKDGGQTLNSPLVDNQAAGTTQGGLGLGPDGQAGVLGEAVEAPDDGQLALADPGSGVQGIDQLPRTGSSLGVLALFGAMLTGLGSFVVREARRRPQTTEK